MVSEEKMNVDTENQENFAKKKKITIICLSAALVFIILIAGLFLMKKNKENRENNDIEKAVNENNKNIENNNDDDHENDGVIVNEGDYFFAGSSGQKIENTLLVTVSGLLFFLWENLRTRKDKKVMKVEINNVNNYKNGGGDIDGDADDGAKCAKCKAECIQDLTAMYGHGNNQIVGLIEKDNWYCLLSLMCFIASTLFVECVINQLLIGSVSYFFSKDKNKKYLYTLKMCWEKRRQILSSLLKTKTFFIIFGYLFFGFLILSVARLVPKICCRDVKIETV